MDVGELTYKRWRTDIRHCRNDFSRWRTRRWRTDTLAKRPVTEAGMKPIVKSERSCLFEVSNKTNNSGSTNRNNNANKKVKVKAYVKAKARSKQCSANENLSHTGKTEQLGANKKSSKLILVTVKHNVLAM